MVDEIQDPRRMEPSFLLEDREMLEAWLEFHRATLLLKCEGLDDDRRKARPIATSKLSLHGLVRHMAEVERNWFRRVLLSQPDTPPIWYDPAVDDSELVPLDDALGGRLVCLAGRVRGEPSSRGASALADTGLRRGTPCSLRWIYVHMIEEYARHNGHADLIRELLDGAVGW